MKSTGLFLICMFTGRMIFAQLVNDFKLSDLQTPNAPGFVLADKAPSSIEKPVNPRTFAVSLYNLREGGAVETTPFWWFQQPSYDVNRYLRPVPFLSTFNLSMATFKTDSSSVFSGGFRANVIRLFPAAKKTKMQHLDTEASFLIALDGIDDTSLNDIPDAQLGSVGGSAFRNLVATEREKTIYNAIDSLVKLIDTERRKPVFQVSLAGAYLGASANNSFKNLKATKAGIWLNAQWSPANIPLSILALGRYSRQVGEAKTGSEDSAYLDYGIGLSYERNSFDAALEYINRRDFAERKNYDRLVFVVNYQVIEEVTLVASFGKNFKEMNNLFTVFGTKIGISRSKVKLSQ